MRNLVILLTVGCLAVPALAGERGDGSGLTASKLGLTAPDLSSFVRGCALEKSATEQRSSICDLVSSVRLHYLEVGKAGERSLQFEPHWLEMLEGFREQSGVTR